MKALFDCTSSQIPDPYPFPFIARAPWPKHYSKGFNLDWVDSIECVEDWLETRVGSHLVQWMWSTTQEQQYWECCVAFKWDRDRTLFLLQWAI